MTENCGGTGDFETPACRLDFTCSATSCLFACSLASSSSHDGKYPPRVLSPHLQVLLQLLGKHICQKEATLIPSVSPPCAVESAAPPSASPHPAAPAPRVTAALEPPDGHDVKRVNDSPWQCSRRAWHHPHAAQVISSMHMLQVSDRPGVALHAICGSQLAKPAYLAVPMGSESRGRDPLRPQRLASCS